MLAARNARKKLHRAKTLTQSPFGARSRAATRRCVRLIATRSRLRCPQRRRARDVNAAQFRGLTAVATVTLLFCRLLDIAAASPLRMASFETGAR